MSVLFPTLLPPASALPPRTLTSIPPISSSITADITIATGRGAAAVEGGASTSRVAGKGGGLTSASSAAAVLRVGKGWGIGIAASMIHPVALLMLPRRAAHPHTNSPPPIFTTHPPTAPEPTPDPPVVPVPLPIPRPALPPPVLPAAVPIPLPIFIIERAGYLAGQGGVACPNCIGRPMRRSQEKRGGASGLRDCGSSVALPPPSSLRSPSPHARIARLPPAQRPATTTLAPACGRRRATQLAPRTRVWASFLGILGHGHRA